MSYISWNQPVTPQAIPYIVKKWVPLALWVEPAAILCKCLFSLFSRCEGSASERLHKSSHVHICPISRLWGVKLNERLRGRLNQPTQEPVFLMRCGRVNQATSEERRRGERAMRLDSLQEVFSQWYTFYSAVISVLKVRKIYWFLVHHFRKRIHHNHK